MNTTTASRRGVRTLFGALAAVLFGALVATGLPLAAAASPDAHLTVKVTNKSGTPLAGVSVLAIPVPDESFPYAEYDFGDEEAFAELGGVQGSTLSPVGSYRLSGLETDLPYVLAFFPSGSTSGAHVQFLGGSTVLAEAERVQYAAGEHSLDVSLAANSSFTGKVTNSSGTGLRNIWVNAYRWDGADWALAETAETASSGTYALRNLDAGSYKLEFDGWFEDTGYVSEFSGDKPTLAAATAFDLKFGATITHNAKLATGGKITGKVRYEWYDDEWDETYVFGADLVTPVAYPLLGTSPSFTGIDVSRPYYGKQTTTSGTWTVPGLPTGHYVVRLYDWAYDELETRYAGSGTGGLSWSSGSTQKYSVTAGTTASPSTISTILPWQDDVPRAALNLHVQDELSADVEGAEVVLESTTDDFWFEGETDADGDIQVPRLLPDTYELRIVSYAENGSGERLHNPHVTELTVGGSSAINETVTLADFEPLAITSAEATSVGANKVGEEFTAEAESSLLGGVDFYYQWKRDGVPIYGARSAEYQLASGDAGHQISVLIAARAFGYPAAYETVELSGLTAEGDAPELEHPGGFGITNAAGVLNPDTAKPGEKLTASPSLWLPAGASFSYQWLADGAPIGGATGKTYTVTPADADNAVDLSVEVTASRVGHATAAPLETEAIEVVLLSPPLNTTAPTVSKTTSGVPAGQTKYTVSKGSWSVSGLNFTCRWYNDGDFYTETVDTCFQTPGSNSIVWTTAAPEMLEVEIIAHRSGYADGNKGVIVRKGTYAMVTLLEPPVVHNTSNEDEPITSDTQPVYLGDVLEAQPTDYGYPSAGPGTVTVKYQWYRNGSAISGATKQSYKVTTSDLGKQLLVRVVTTSSHYGSDLRNALGGVGTLRPELIEGSHPDLYIDGTSGTGTVHSSLTIGPWDVTGVSHSWQWYSCAEATLLECGEFFASSSWVKITGATSWSYTPPASLDGRFLGLAMTAKKSGYTTRVLFADLATPLSANPQLEFLFPGVPWFASGLVEGSAQFGRTVTVDPGRVNVSSPTIAYQWLVCDYQNSGDCADAEDYSEIPGATAKSYTPAASLLVAYPNPLLKVRVTASKLGFTSVTEFTDAVELDPGELKASTAPKVTSGTTAWTASVGVWNVPVTSQVDWAVDGVVTLTNSPTFPKAGTTGQLVEAIVTLSADGFVSVERTVLAQKGTPTPTPGAAVTGDTFGQTLVAPGVGDLVDYPDGTSPDPSVKYQWYSGSSAIDGATKSTFKPSSSYVGKSLKVRVTASSAKFATVSVFSGVVVLQKASFDGGASLDVVSKLGTTVLCGCVNLVGAKHTVTPVDFGASSVSYSYRWYSSTNGTTWTALSTTSSSYTVPLSMLGKHLKVVVTAKKTGYNTLVLEEDFGEVIETAELSPVTVPTLPSAKVGAVVSVDVGTWNASSVSFSYEWYRNGVLIPGVTGASWTPTAESVDDTLYVEVTATKAGYVTGTVSTNLVVIQPGDAPVATTAPKITLTNGGTAATVSTGVWNRSGLSFSYEWFSGSTSLGTGNSYTFTGSEETGSVYVVVTASSPAYLTGSAVSNTQLIPV